ncbi:MAG: hypothetical protein OXT65_10890 [Alphaproteobacteria bacterium]|nr:hypothetical protein [Alphaproteobacteria bacterium]
MMKKLKGLFISNKKRQAFAEKPRDFPSAYKDEDMMYTAEFMDKDGVRERNYRLAVYTGEGDEWNIMDAVRKNDTTEFEAVGRLGIESTLLKMQEYERKMDAAGHERIKGQAGNYVEKGLQHGYSISADNEVGAVDRDAPVVGTVLMNAKELAARFGSASSNSRISTAQDVENFINMSVTNPSGEIQKLFSAPDSWNAPFIDAMTWLEERVEKTVTQKRRGFHYIGSDIESVKYSFKYSKLYELNLDERGCEETCTKCRKEKMEPLVDREVLAAFLKRGHAMAQNLVTDDGVDTAVASRLQRLKSDIKDYVTAYMNMPEKQANEMLDVMIKDPAILNIKTPARAAIEILQPAATVKKPLKVQKDNRGWPGN